MQKSAKKGFTLIELLVVIAIIAVLSIVVILTLNPAELLKQARDSNRISDLGTLKSAISLFLADTASSTGLGTAATCYEAKGTPSSSCSTWFTSLSASHLTGNSTSRNVNATGWIPINFNAISSGSPIGNEPVDPLCCSNTSFWYSYISRPASSTFKLGAFMESTKYGLNGTGDVVSTDGGSSSSVYETGTDLSL